MAEKAGHTGSPDDPWEDLVVSVLAVNQYSIEKTYQHLDSLRQQGLFSPENLARWDHEELLRRLRAGGCDRGEFMTNLFAQRLANLGRFVEAKGVDVCSTVLFGRDVRAIEALLLPVNGVGPKVVHNFCLLREIQES